MSRARGAGDPTEGALLVAAAKAGMSREDLEAVSPRIGEVPFNSEAMRMVTAHRTPGGATVAYVKGGPAVASARVARALASAVAPALSRSEASVSGRFMPVILGRGRDGV